MKALKKVEPFRQEESEQTTLIERADGFYWQDKRSGDLSGPFATMAEAMEDAEYQEESEYNEGVSLQEAEEEIGIAGHLDLDTGELTEGSVLHISD